MMDLVELSPPLAPMSAALRPELLAPAGDWDCVRAAIENGADAIYLGLDCGFNARARAANFAPQDLPRLMELLHSRGVRGYVTLNTLAFTDELSEVEQLVRLIAAAGVDAVLIQDLGVARLVRAICPDLPMHASTQMTLTSGAGLEFARSLGIERAVMAREMSIREIRKLHGQSPLPLEAFVHGALCVAYSGQCLTSESLGGRSANRGQCAQACRLPYDLICDGRDVETGDVKYLLSPQDLAGFELIPQLMEAGVCSLKIEGRLKTPEYVANLTRHYREAIDSAVTGQPVRFTPRQIEEMELSFSRGFSPGWLEGCHHKRLVPGQSSSKRGVFLGRVLAVHRGRIVVRLEGSSVKRGDGLAFDCGKPVDDPQGGRVYEIFRRGKSLERAEQGEEVELAFARNAIDFTQIWEDQQVWKTDDPELTSRLRATFQNQTPRRQMAIDVAVAAGEGERLRVVARTETGVVVRVVSQDLLATAQKHALTADTLRQQLGRLGGTAFTLRQLDARIEGRPMAPFSVLGQIRHELVQKLQEAVVKPPERRIDPGPTLVRLRAEDAAKRTVVTAVEQPTLHVLVRSLSQLQTVLSTGIRDVYVDFQDLREYHSAVRLAREAEARILLATPRIEKPDEKGMFHLLAKQGADGVLVRNLGGLLFFGERGIPRVVDFSLNVANELAAQLFHDQGPLRITPSYDLNRDQLLDLVRAVPASWLEVVIHQHMPMFHMEHCVFCAMLSPGTNKTNCGRPCDRHDVKLRDRIGVEHPLKADVGCRNTLFNAVPQSAAEVVPTLLDRGVRHFRIELLNDSPTEIARTIQLYRELLAGRVTGRDVWGQLQATNRVGVTRGTLEERRDPLAIL
jgi:putative protease